MKEEEKRNEKKHQHPRSMKGEEKEKKKAGMANRRGK